eukprot:TRINITY_DN11669_c0_g2_i1.p2 TRINITY_DN11669_c0_g2~~TRINITY_DN11669_c0_g2_i1.p2  ORF type:complete len:109 (-),score=37.99 TRINITY_DN11669_c0_g2_i1:111-437(-)
MEYVEKEILNIQLERKNDIKTIEEKSHLLEEAQGQNKQLVADLKSAEEEVEEIKKVLIAYKTEKEKEVSELTHKLMQTEADMKVLIEKIDEMKREAKEKLRILGSMFK